MTNFYVMGQFITLPAFSVSNASTRDSSAWLDGFYITIRLTESVSALRVHTNGKEFDNRPASSINGAWFAIGDIIQTSSEYASSRSLPGYFSHVAFVELPPETVLNLGICSPHFGGEGGGFQVEYVSGPLAIITHSEFKWGNRYGNA